MTSPSPVAMRPWFLSLTALWHEAEGFDDLKQWIDNWISTQPRPFYHLSVPQIFWHSTVLAIIRINQESAEDISAASVALNLFKEFQTASDLLRKVQQSFTEPIKLQATHLRCFNDNTTIQFRDSEDIRAFRSNVRPLFRSTVDPLVRGECGVESLLDDRNKSIGPRFFGSIYRSAHPFDRPVLRWEVPIKPAPTLTFKKIHFLVSDDGLTNPRKEGENDLVISGGSSQQTNTV